MGRDDHVDLARHELGRQRRQSVALALGPAQRDLDGPAFDVAEVTQAPSELLDEGIGR